MLITVDGKSYRLVGRDLTALDAQDFRANVGVGLQAALRSFDFDLDRVAGYVWLIRRRTEKDLTFRSVAMSMNYDTEIIVDLKPLDADDEEAGDPEA